MMVSEKKYFEVIFLKVHDMTFSDKENVSF